MHLLARFGRDFGGAAGVGGAGFFEGEVVEAFVGEEEFAACRVDADFHASGVVACFDCCGEQVEGFVGEGDGRREAAFVADARGCEMDVSVWVLSSAYWDCRTYLLGRIYQLRPSSTSGIPLRPFAQPQP